MSVKTYSKKKDGNKYLTKNFRVQEFASKDGADTILIDTKLVDYLQQIRDKFGLPVIISSAYRTKAHNKAVGGATNSYHTRGMAADIIINGVESKRTAAYAEAIGVQGIGWYESQKFCHIDTRTGKYFWKDSGSNAYKTFSSCPYGEPFYNLSSGVSGNGVKWAQWHLNKLGFTLNIDGSFGAKTQSAVKIFQNKFGLTADGIIGKNTRKILKMEVV